MDDGSDPVGAAADGAARALVRLADSVLEAGLGECLDDDAGAVGECLGACFWTSVALCTTRGGGLPKFKTDSCCLVTARAQAERAAV
ncbi:hypothetical protein GCM10017667_69900 [Streptomyces filamentosus]|uniref:Uncharacterized protein n=1 Tax=Streptomyces filamentosus TaxID=67294 RepID=A0A919ES86_STRFL|nr:hypothetical protein GCM10017667_69900 [Streptomyces filamentosus]